MVNLQRSKQSAHDLIMRWGGGVGQLVRDGVRRDAFMGISDYSVRERGNFADKSTRILISVLPSDPLVDYEQDLIEFKGKRYSILLPPGGPRPAGEAIFYDCNCMYRETI